MLIERVASDRTKLLCLLLLLVFLLRMAWIGLFPTELYADSIWYYEQAINLYQGKGYVYQGLSTAIWPVGYPAFLAGIFKLLLPSVFSAKLANVGLLTLDAVLIYQYARLTTTKDYIAPYFVVIVVAFMPSHIAASSLVAVEALFAFLLHLTLVLLLFALKWRLKRLWIFVGSLIGILAYVRPESIVILLIVLLFFVLNKQNLTEKLLSYPWLLLFLIIIPIIIILPWTVRNWFKLGMFVPMSTTACMNLWIGHAPDSEGSYYWSSDPSVNPTIWLEDDTEQTWYRRSCAAAIDLLRTNPIRVVELWPKKIFKLWQDDHGLLSWNLSKTTQPLLPQQTKFLYTITDSYYYVIMLFGCCGIVWQVWRLMKLVGLKKADYREVLARNSCYLVGIVTIIGFTAVFLPFFGASRFHFALTPLLAVYAVDFIVNEVERFRFNLLS